MKDISKEQLIKRFQILSDTLQDAIFSESTSESIRKSAVLGDIDDQTSRLAVLVGYVLMGYLNPSDLSKEIEGEFGIDGNIAKQVAHQLDAEIFSLVDADLRKLYPPTIKTPTVVAKGFSKAEEKAYEKKDEKRLSEFEKRFLSKKLEEPAKVATVIMAKPAVEERKEEKKQEPMPTVMEKIEKAEPVIPVEAKPEVAKIPIRPVPAPKERKLEFEEVRMAQRPEEKQEQRSKEAENIPYIRPVVPLPTFMQSQFQPRKRPESAYQEKVSEEELKPKPPTEKKLAPKISGNVIDLRDL